MYWNKDKSEPLCNSLDMLYYLQILLDYKWFLHGSVLPYYMIYALNGHLTFLWACGLMWLDCLATVILQISWQPLDLTYFGLLCLQILCPRQVWWKWALAASAAKVSFFKVSGKSGYLKGTSCVLTHIISVWRQKF